MTQEHVDALRAAISLWPSLLVRQGMVVAG
jgi:hypothetical protein